MSPLIEGDLRALGHAKKEAVADVEVPRRGGVVDGQLLQRHQRTSQPLA